MITSVLEQSAVSDFRAFSEDQCLDPDDHNLNLSWKPQALPASFSGQQ
jgi:hypothetical protein